jgi:hypothetical protein
VATRDAHGRFLPGESPNASGRPPGFKGLSRKISEQTSEGAELVEFALRVLRDEAAEMRDRLSALVWLGDRGFGKPVQSVELTADITATAHRYALGDAIAAMPIEERRQAFDVLRKARALGDAEPDQHEDPRLLEPRVTDEEPT